MKKVKILLSCIFLIFMFVPLSAQHSISIEPLGVISDGWIRAGYSYALNNSFGLAVNGEYMLYPETAVSNFSLTSYTGEIALAYTPFAKKDLGYKGYPYTSKDIGHIWDYNFQIGLKGGYFLLDPTAGSTEEQEAIYVMGMPIRAEIRWFVFRSLKSYNFPFSDDIFIRVPLSYTVYANEYSSGIPFLEDWFDSSSNANFDSSFSPLKLGVYIGVSL